MDNITARVMVYWSSIFVNVLLDMISKLCTGFDVHLNKLYTALEVSVSDSQYGFFLILVKPKRLQPRKSPRGSWFYKVTLSRLPMMVQILFPLLYRQRIRLEPSRLRLPRNLLILLISCQSNQFHLLLLRLFQLFKFLHLLNLIQFHHSPSQHNQFMISHQGFVRPLNPSISPRPKWFIIWDPLPETTRSGFICPSVTGKKNGEMIVDLLLKRKMNMWCSSPVCRLRLTCTWNKLMH